MAVQFNKRAYQVFLSHSSKDKLSFVDGLRSWLTNCCGVRVYYDRDAEAVPIASQVATAIGNSQAAVFVVSAGARASGWVRSEYNAIHEEAMRHEQGRFRIVGIQLDETEPIEMLQGVKLLRARDDKLLLDDSLLLLETLFGGGDPTGGKPVYFARGWHPPDAPLAEMIQSGVNEFGLRLIADWPTQESYDDNRIDRLIGGCGALVAVLPSRDGAKTSKYILREIHAAQNYGLPCLVFADKRVEPGADWLFPIISVEVERAGPFHEIYGDRVEELALSWRKPPLGQHVFIGHSDAAAALAPMHRMIARLTGLPVVYGKLVEGSDVPGEIVQNIRDAEFCIIDITNPYADANLPEKANFALNSAIEAGIAMGAGRPVYLTCAGRERTPPFMFRTNQVRYYTDEMQLAGFVNQFCARHRRLVIR